MKLSKTIEQLQEVMCAIRNSIFKDYEREKYEEMIGKYCNAYNKYNKMTPNKMKKLDKETRKKHHKRMNYYNRVLREHCREADITCKKHCVVHYSCPCGGCGEYLRNEYDVTKRF